jgi:hypothetical protein
MAKSSEEEFTQPKIVQLRRIEDLVLAADIEGVTPVIPHRWSEKSLRMMRDKQMSATSAPRARKEPKNPEEEAHDSCYWLTVVKAEQGYVTVSETGDGRIYGSDGIYYEGLPVETKGAIPATAFKAAMVGACRFYEGITMTQAKLLFYVEGEGPDQLVPIEGEPVMREDTPRNSGGTADLRYRMQFWPWSARLLIHFLPSMIGPDSVYALLDAAGKGGVGDWRPSSPKSATGTYGQFRLVTV